MIKNMIGGKPQPYTSQQLQLVKQFAPTRIMLFDLSINGHHPAYLQHLIQFWGEQGLSGCLDIVVSSQFCQQHRQVVDFAAQYDNSQINFVAISATQEAALKPRHSGISRTQRAFQEWKLCCDYAAQLHTSHCLLLYVDTCLLPLALSRQPPCPVSGIYFRPSFHYANFSNYPPSTRNYWQSWREKLVLRQVLHNPQFKTLFCLDPFAVKLIQKFSGTTEVVALPDPVRPVVVTEAQVQQLKQKLQVEPHRKVLLLFGALNGRKGIYETLAALPLLPPTTSKQLCLVLAGQINPNEQLKLTAAIQKTQQQSPVQILYYPGFISESEVPVFFQMADIVLAPYQQHVGMSGILLQAAAAGRPVLSSDYGLMGELVRRYRLGQVVASQHPREIAQGLIHCLEQKVESWSDPQLMQAFVELNAPERFASLLLQPAMY